jgi:hypothetical protein
MGQYYLTLFLAEQGIAQTEIAPFREQPGSAKQTEFIRAWMCGRNYSNGVKLTEHSWLGNNFMSAVEFALCPDGPFYKSRVVWAGDYADEEADGKTLYKTAQGQPHKEIRPEDSIMHTYRYIVNHTKKQYVDKEMMKAEPMYGLRVHPLSLLTAEGNGRGGGDYRGAHEELVGTWARDVISVEKEVPLGYSPLKADFFER